MNLLINIDVDDLDRAIRFYCHVFDLHTGRRLGPDIIELLGGPAPIYLLKKSARTAASPQAAQQRSYERHWTPVHFDFVVEDIDAAVRKAIDAGAIMEGAVTTHSWGRIATLADPFGHGFCLLQFLGRGYDEIAE